MSVRRPLKLVRHRVEVEKPKLIELSDDEDVILTHKKPLLFDPTQRCPEEESVEGFTTPQKKRSSSKHQCLINSSDFGNRRCIVQCEDSDESQGNFKAKAKGTIPGSVRTGDEKKRWDPKDASRNQEVKACLHISTKPENIICRDEELDRVYEFCKVCMEREEAGSLYVCGCPGTGKSLLLEKVRVLCTEWAKQAARPPCSAFVNCTSLTHPSDIFLKILEQLHGRRKCLNSKSALRDLKSLLCGHKSRFSSKMMLLIVDEIDYLRDQAVLYELFKLSTLPNSRCMLVGISNSIDLTDRLLPKLQSFNCKPLVVTFRAYSKNQILKILHQRLMVLPYQVFQPEALELCSRKVAAASGDMRKALEVCRNALELSELELNEQSGLDDFQETSTLQKDEPPANMVRMDHMAKALAKTFKSAVVDTIQSLPRHQQIVLCSAIKFLRSGKKYFTVGELHSAYLKFCKATSMFPLNGIEFSSMCRVLNDQALLNLGKAQEDRLRRVSLRVHEGDVAFALQGIRFFRDSLQSV